MVLICFSFPVRFIRNLFGQKFFGKAPNIHRTHKKNTHRACIYYTGPVYITMLIHKKIRKTVNIYLPEHFGALNIVWDGLSLTWDDEIFVNTESTFRLFAVDNMLSKFSKSP